MKPENVIGGMELPHEVEMIEFGFVDDGRRLRVEALDTTYKIVEAREVMIDDEGDDSEAVVSNGGPQTAEGDE